MSVDWIKELCPEIAEWQAELIAEQAQEAVEAEREACAEIVERNADACVQSSIAEMVLRSNAAAIRARGQA